MCCLRRSSAVRAPMFERSQPISGICSAGEPTCAICDELRSDDSTSCSSRWAKLRSVSDRSKLKTRRRGAVSESRVTDQGHALLGHFGDLRKCHRTFCPWSVSTMPNRQRHRSRTFFEERQVKSFSLGARVPRNRRGRPMPLHCTLVPARFGGGVRSANRRSACARR